MKLTNETEEKYRAVKRSMEAINIKIPAGVDIMINIVDICGDISDGLSAEEIIRKHTLPCKKDSFSSIFKKTTGVSIKDIPSMTAFDRRRRKLKASGYEAEQIDEILAIVTD